MAEEITYIPYGLDEISQLDLMTSLANGIESYLGSKRWARKDKYRLAWLDAYQDIMNKGLRGASNDTGIWKISYNGDEEFDSKSNAEKEMYLDAAYYIQLLMSRMTPRKKIEEKKPLTSFNFYEDFNNHLLKGYGNSREIFADPEQGWDSLDARGENGLRKTDNRKAAMIKALQEYSNNLLEGKYNFEGTQFADLKDAKAKILAAIDALKTNKESDDLQAFSALGLKYRSYFSNGGNDYSEHINPETNTPYTWSDWNKAEEERLKKEAEANVAKAKAAKQAAYNNTLFFNRVTNSKMFGQNALALIDKYKDHNTLFAALQGYAQRDIRTLSPQEQSEVQGAYRYLAKDPIDNKVLNQLRASSSGLYKNAAPNRFRKIKGIDNLIWDSVANQVIQINTRLQQLIALNLPLDLFANIKTKEDLQLIPRGKGIELTDADYRDIYATVADLGALINPEIFSGTAMALSASGARTWNSIEQRGVLDTLTDWKTWADWGTGALGGTALLGDASSAVKVVRGFGKLMTIPAIYLSLNSIPEAKAAWDKIDLSNPIESAKKLTPQDYHALSTFLMGIISGKNYLRGNLAERAVLKHSGVNTESKSKIREYSNKFGITRTKPQSQETVSTLKVKKTEKDGKTSELDITITKEQKAAIQKAKSSEVEKAAKDAGVKIPEGYKIEVNKSKINAAKSYFGKGNSEIIGKKTQEASKGKDDFDNWLENRGTWSKWKLGTNKNLRQIKKNLGINTAKQETSENKSETPQLETAELKQLENKSTTLREQQYNKATINRYKEHLKGNFSNKKLLSGDYNLNGNNLRVVEQLDGTFNIIYKGDIKGNYQKHLLKELQLKVFDLVKENRKTIDKQSGKSTKKSTAEIGKILLLLKKKGWLKQGGQINSLDKVIEDFLKNSNI